MAIDFLIGADPEFTILRGNSVVRASDYGSDDNTFGADGNGVTFEVRPKPNRNPLVVVSNIRDSFGRAIKDYDDLNNCKWKAGSFESGYPMGGHIHFGIKNMDYRPLVNILDHYLGVILVLAENRVDGLERRRSGYGGVSDHRQQSYGIEYRAISSWLSSPYVAAASLCLAKTVTYEFLNNAEMVKFSFLDRDDFGRMRTKPMLEQFPAIWKQIVGMKLYQEYKPYIDLLYFLITNKLSWLPNDRDMKETWGVFNLKFPAEKIPMDIVWARYKQQIGA